MQEWVLPASWTWSLTKTGLFLKPACFLCRLCSTTSWSCCSNHWAFWSLARCWADWVLEHWFAWGRLHLLEAHCRRYFICCFKLARAAVTSRRFLSSPSFSSHKTGSARASLSYAWSLPPQYWYFPAKLSQFWFLIKHYSYLGNPLAANFPRISLHFRRTVWYELFFLPRVGGIERCFPMK